MFPDGFLFIYSNFFPLSLNFFFNSFSFICVLPLLLHFFPAIWFPFFLCTVEFSCTFVVREIFSCTIYKRFDIPKPQRIIQSLSVFFASRSILFIKKFCSALARKKFIELVFAALTWCGDDGLFFALSLGRFSFSPTWNSRPYVLLLRFFLYNFHRKLYNFILQSTNVLQKLKFCNVP